MEFLDGGVSLTSTRLLFFTGLFGAIWADLGSGGTSGSQIREDSEQQVHGEREPLLAQDLSRMRIKYLMEKKNNRATRKY